MTFGLLAGLSLVLLPSLAPPLWLHWAGPGRRVDASSRKPHVLATRTRRTVPLAREGAVPQTFCFRRLSSAPGGPDGPAPLLLYLPGIDGSGLSGGTQWGRLSSELTIEVLSLTPGDRSTFDQLVVGICGHIAGLEPPRRVLLCGESTGAVLALGAALAEPGLVSALCLVNPGTAYDGSPLSVVAPLLPRLPPQLYSVGPSLVTPLLGKPGWFNPLIQLPADEKLPTGAAQVLEASRRLADLLPPEALAWRLREQLGAGAVQVNGRLRDRSGGVRFPWESSTLLIAGDQDLLLPSSRETARLASLLRGAKRRVLAGVGHAALDDPALNLRLELTLSGVLGRLRPASARPLPTVDPAPASLFEEWLQGMKRLFSPVFFSLDGSDGAMVPGLDALPSLDGPTLLVGNHQLFGFDGPLIIEELLREKGVLASPLVFPPLLEATSPLAPLPYPLPGTAATFARFNATPVSGRNLFSLLKRGQTVLLFPGGAREVFKRKGEDYTLFWPEEPDLVRVAARLNATLIPFSGLGGDESMAILMDSQELLDAPAAGDFFRSRIAGLPSFVDGDVFVPPVGLITPQRHYFLFGQPISTRDIDPADRRACEEAYGRLRAAVRGGVGRLQRVRDRDPYRDLLPRTAYEAATGAPAPAPAE